MMADNKNIYLEETNAEKDIGVIFDLKQNFRPQSYGRNMQKSK